MNRLPHLIATCGPIGQSRWAPGTLGSLVAVPLILWIDPFGFSYLGLTAVIVFVGIWASSITSRDLGEHDPSSVVIDEVAGLLVAFLWIPVSGKTLVIGFILFRLFDTLKPPPIKTLERLPRGYGIVLDDVLAGVYANLILQGLWRYAHL